MRLYSREKGAEAARGKEANQSEIWVVSVLRMEIEIAMGLPSASHVTAT